MKAIFISFNQAHYEDILRIMEHNHISGFTCWENVIGRGSNTGEPHYGNHTWSMINSSILTFVEDSAAEKFLEHLHKLDKEFEAQGLRAFYWDIGGTI
ncbi:MAG: PG0541 family transporter-associated protein [Rikenellaceae bacterium]